MTRTNHEAQNMTSPKSEQLVPTMTVEAASRYAEGIYSMVGNRVRSGDPGELDWEFAAVERQYGVGFWTIEHLRKKKAKTCDISVFAKLKAAYLDLCERKAKALLHEVATERAKGDDTNADIGAELEEILAKVAARKAGLRFAAAPNGERNE